MGRLSVWIRFPVHRSTAREPHALLASAAVPSAPAASDPFGPGLYRRRRPEKTPLYAVFQHHVETFLTTAAEQDPLGTGARPHVERDFRAYLRCGILAHGFACARCDGCGHDFIVAFSCKGRGVCPSCNTRRMVDVAAHLTDHVFPLLPVRQYVLSVPKRLRPFLSHNPKGVFPSLNRAQHAGVKRRRVRFGERGGLRAAARPALRPLLFHAVPRTLRQLALSAAAGR